MSTWAFEMSSMSRTDSCSPNYSYSLAAAAVAAVVAVVVAAAAAVVVVVVVGRVDYFSRDFCASPSCHWSSS